MELPAVRWFNAGKKHKRLRVCSDAAADHFFSSRLFTCGSQQRGAQMILDENTVVVAITETKLY